MGNDALPLIANGLQVAAVFPTRVTQRMTDLLRAPGNSDQSSANFWPLSWFRQTAFDTKRSFALSFASVCWVRLYIGLLAVPGLHKLKANQGGYILFAWVWRWTITGPAGPSIR